VPLPQPVFPNIPPFQYSTIPGEVTGKRITGQHMNTFKSLIISVLIVAPLVSVYAAAPEKKKPLTLDVSKAIPLRESKYNIQPFSISFYALGEGGEQGAIKKVSNAETNDLSLDVWFDTGSIETVIPYGALDKSKLTVLKKNVSYFMCPSCDQVKGTLFLKSTDGTIYTLRDYVFYARKMNDGSADAPDDRLGGKTCGGGIVGGRWGAGSLAHALSKAYSPNHIGVGIISLPGSDINKGYSTLHSYLSITPERESNLFKSMTWISNMDHPSFYDAVPGFSVTFKFAPTTNNPTPPADITVDHLAGTIDTGAPDLELKISEADPQYTAAYAPYFKGPLVGWMNDPNHAVFNAVTLGQKNRVTVSLKCDDNKTASYQFTLDPESKEANGNPSGAFVCKWTSGHPFGNFNKRFNVGNSPYFFWNYILFDMTNKKMGIYKCENEVRFP
jgi:hypothetical protein